MSRYEIEIIPPGQVGVPTVQRPSSAAGSIVAAPAPPSRDFIGRFFQRKRVNEEIQALTLYEERAKAEQQYWDKQTAALESAMKCREAAFRQATQGQLVERQHAEELRELQNRSELAELRRRMEIAQAEATLIAAETGRDCARDYGSLAQRQRHENDLLDLHLAAEERRAVLRQYLDRLQERDQSSDPRAGAIDDALYEARAQMHAHGLDTTRIDTLIEQRRARR